MEERNELRDLIFFSWAFVKPFFYAVMLYAVVAVAYDEWSRLQPVSQKQESHWINYDSSKRAEDVAELDYESRLIRYRVYLRENEKDAINRIDPKVFIDVGDYIDWYDISDYYDLYEYYHD